MKDKTDAVRLVLDFANEEALKHWFMGALMTGCVGDDVAVYRADGTDSGVVPASRHFVIRKSDTRPDDKKLF